MHLFIEALFSLAYPTDTHTCSYTYAENPLPHHLCKPPLATKVILIMLMSFIIHTVWK